jgi:hypothetical protein
MDKLRTIGEASRVMARALREHHADMKRMGAVDEDVSVHVLEQRVRDVAMENEMDPHLLGAVGRNLFDKSHAFWPKERFGLAGNALREAAIVIDRVHRRVLENRPVNGHDVAEMFR